MLFGLGTSRRPTITCGDTDYGEGKQLSGLTCVLSDSNLPYNRQYYYGSRLLFILVMGASRASVLALLYRLTPIRSHQLCSIVLMVILGGWTLAFFVVFALGCNASRPWAVIGQNCSNLVSSTLSSGI